MSENANPNPEHQGDRLIALVSEVFLLPEDEVRPDLRRDEIDTWDSLGTVALAVGVEEEFGYHMTPDEASELASIGDIAELLTSRGISLDSR